MVVQHKIGPIRYRWKTDRSIDLDLRGIRNPHSPMNGRLNPSKGMKRKFLSPEHLQSMINEYFESCNGPMLDKYGRLVRDEEGHIVKTQVKPYTVSGLALYLGISTTTLKKYREGKVDTLLDEMKAETEDCLTFSKVVLRAKQKIESYAESRMYDKDGQRGAQFILDSCFGWVDHKTSSDVKRSKAETKIRKEELRMKKSLLEGTDSDSDIVINIVRGKKKDNEEVEE